MSQSTAFTFGGWIALLAGIWFLFDKSETVASQETKLTIARWLKRLEVGRSAPPWPDTFARLFDATFGSRHLSYKCFFRSCVASLLAALLMLFLWAAFRPDLFATFSNT